MEMFRTTGGTSIEKYVVIKETDKSITFINHHLPLSGRRVFYNDTERKVSNWHSWHKTFAEAQNYLLDGKGIELKSVRDKEAYILRAIDVIAAIKESDIETIG